MNASSPNNSIDQSAALVIFVRHGQTDFNLERRFQGQRDVPLNDTGQEQAKRAGLFLQGLFEQRPGARQLKLRSISSSDLARAYETAALIQNCLHSQDSGKDQGEKPPTAQLLAQPKKMEINKSSLLREIDVGLFEGFTFAECLAAHPVQVENYMQAFERDRTGTPYPPADASGQGSDQGLDDVTGEGSGGESQSDVAKRMLDFYGASHRAKLNQKWPWSEKQLWQGTQTDIVVSHGAALTILFEHLGIGEFQNENKCIHIGNADCLITAHFEGRVQLLYHAKISE